eukprot:g17634.t1
MLPSCEFMRMSAEVEHEESKAEMVHSDPEAPIVVSMTPAPEFQVESLQLLLLEQEQRIKCAWLPVLWHYFVDFIALSYVIFIGINLQFGSHGGPLEWALPIEILFCSVIGVDLLVKMCTQQQKFFTGPRRWWNFFDSFCLLVLIVAAAQGSRGLETASGLVRGGRALRIVGCFSTVQELRQFKQLRVMIASMIRSLKVMLWPALMVFVFNYFCGLILTESMWSNCPNSSILCEKFGDLQSSMITLYQIQYSGMLWHEVWHEMQHSEWYVQVFFICSTVFGLMVVVNATTSFMCGLQSYIWKKERATFSDLEEELKKFYASFREIDQNHNGTISEVEFKLVMENEQMLALLEALDVDTSDAVKVFEILASQSTGGIEVTDFLLGCLRLQRGTTAVDIIRIQMQQEWGHDALVSMSTVLQKTSADFQEALHSLSITTTAMEPLILTTNLVPGESSVAKTKREQDFPIDLLGRGLELCLEEGNATVKEDKEHIFRAIADNYDLSSEEGEAMQKKGRPGMDKICNALRSDGFRESLELSLAHVEGCDNAAVKKLAESLPSSLKNLKLSFEGCSHLTDSSVQALAGQVSQLKSLEILHLDFVGCEYLTDASLKSVGDRVSKSKLIELELHFAGCKRLQEGGVLSLQENLPESLRHFKANFKGTHVDRTFDNLTQFKGYQKSWRPFPFELTA